jgi:hypothetical protein
MVARDLFRWMMSERREYPRASLDFHWRTVAARKYLAIMRGVPVLEWRE